MLRTLTIGSAEQLLAQNLSRAEQARHKKALETDPKAEKNKDAGKMGKDGRITADDIKTEADNPDLNEQKVTEQAAQIFKEWVEKKREDVLTREELDKINKSIDDAVAKVEKELKRRADELEAKANRLALAGGGGEVEAKAVADWAKLLGRKATPDEVREYKTALDAQLRNPEQKATTLQVGIDPAGGYFVTPDTSGRSS